MALGTASSAPRRGLGTPRAAARRKLPAPRIGLTSAGVRWDRLGRVALLFVLGALLYLYLSAGVHMLSTWGQARHDSATVVSMQREHKTLVRQHEALSRQGTVEGEARGLGMKKQGERQYIVPGLPSN